MHEPVDPRQGRRDEATLRPEDVKGGSKLVRAGTVFLSCLVGLVPIVSLEDGAELMRYCGGCLMGRYFGCCEVLCIVVSRSLGVVQRGRLSSADRRLALGHSDLRDSCEAYATAQDGMTVGA